MRIAHFRARLSRYGAWVQPKGQGETEMIIVMGHCRTASGEFDRVTEAMQTQVAATNAEDGCIHYSFARHVSDPDLLIISERWRDQAAIDAHFKSPHMAAFNAVLEIGRASCRERV